MTAREVKKIKDRLLIIEDWIQDREEPSSLPGILENMNFLLDAIRKDKDQFEKMREQQAGERNTMNLVGKFLETNELMEKWEEFFKTEQDSAAKAAEEMNKKEMEKLEKMKKDAEEEGIKSPEEPEIKVA